MSLTATPLIHDGKMRSIDVELRYPSRQEGLSFFEGIDSLPKTAIPADVRAMFYAVIFKSDRVILSKDVLGSKPLYYNSHLKISTFKKFVPDWREVLPGEYLEIGYDGEIIKQEIYSFDSVFKKRDLDIRDVEEIITKSLEGVRVRNACISFSGGVDSSFLTHFYDVPLISVTASKAEEERIRETAKLLGKDVEVLRFGEENVKRALVEVIRAIESTNPLQVSIAIPIHLAMNYARSLGFDEIIFGQGADELFGGYKRYENMIGKNLEVAIEEDVRNIGANNLIRDHKLAYYNQIRLVAPYLSFDIIEAALSIPSSLKVHRGGDRIVRKYILREIASKFIPKEVAYREKKAIQYSTNTYRILEKISRQSGMSLQDFLKGLEWK
ncbi:asparagine synthase C-terminal domain-containing protein [Geoglobus sp.]